MRKIIFISIIIILLAIISLIVIFAFNPANLRAKLIGSIINSYLTDKIEGYEPLDPDEPIKSNDQHPLLNEQQEKTLQNYGVNPAQLPDEISPEMEQCFIEKLGRDRAMQIVNGSAPTATEIFKARTCLGK